jgi:hypothetical protein
LNPFRLFEVLGVELEYALVDPVSLATCPVADAIIGDFSQPGASEADVTFEMSLSNELVRHVIEIKNNPPTAHLDTLADQFQNALQKVFSVCKKQNLTLMPSGMHPFMDPSRETSLWPYEGHEIYESYHQIFNCFRHGWANVQSTHLNLPFANEEEFVRLHTAIRVLLPILPGLAAASPLVDGHIADNKDQRLYYYGINQEKYPIITGSVIPEIADSISAYHKIILEPIEHVMTSVNQDGILKAEFLNSRGAIARFDRSAIEIRICDVQESPLVDSALASFIISILSRLVDEGLSPLEAQRQMPLLHLKTIYDGAVLDAEDYLIADLDYLNIFGLKSSRPVSIQELFRHLYQDSHLPDRYAKVISLVLSHGTLATRIVRALGKTVLHADIIKVYRALIECLSHQKVFLP